MNLLDVMASSADLIASTGVEDVVIQNAETSLSVHFSQEYCTYLRNYGIAAVNGHELTGLSNNKRTNVVDVTFSERHQIPHISCSWYVIEQTNIDGIVIWQSVDGSIYQSSPNTKPVKICNSLCEYITTY